MTIQYADGGRRGSDFPPSWGEPPGDPYSEERTAWILRNIAAAPVRSSSSRSAHAALAKVNALAEKWDGPRSAHAALAKADSLARSSINAWHVARHQALKVCP
jgi:hypothetical protein